MSGVPVRAANHDLPAVLGEHMPSLEQLCKSLPANASSMAENSPARSIVASCAAIQPLAATGGGKIIWEDCPPLINARQSIGALSADAVFGNQHLWQSSRTNT
ncbi:hypothetical protein [Paucibacter soli]|uniref:hypothetical protein n=1 Tax=Paucibacter soli TaxID=3133433 RepID=UPI0030B64869